MKPYALPLIVLASLLVPAAAAVAQPAGDADAAVLRARAERPPDPLGPAGARVAGPGNRLFFHVGPDNGVCVRALPDVTGDGLDEVVIGYDKSQVDNIYCLDGSSSGAATVVWSFLPTDGASGGSPYGDQCLVPISDADGNGYANLLVGTSWGGRTAYDLDGFQGSVLWKLDLYTTPASGWVYSLAELGDVSGDGLPDYVFGAGSDSNSVYLVDGSSSGATPVVRWRYQAGDAVYSVRNLGDMNGDGKDDVLAAIGDNADKILCLDGGTTAPGGVVRWQYIPGQSVYACGVLPDITGDGVNEALAVMWVTSGSTVRCLDGSNGAFLWASTEVNDYGMMVDALEDVTGDGLPEVIVSTWENAVIVLSGADGSLVWKTVVGTVNGGDVWTARAIDDLNGDGRQDVIAGSFDYHVYAMDGDSGEVFWAFDTNNRVFSVAPIGDLNGDGRPEAAAGTQNTNNNIMLHVLEGDAGIPYPGLTLTGSGAIGTPLELEVIGNPGWQVILAGSRQSTSIPKPPYEGTLGLAQPVTKIAKSQMPPNGVYVHVVGIPVKPGLVGQTVYFQGLVRQVNPLQGAFTDLESLVLIE